MFKWWREKHENNNHCERKNHDMDKVNQSSQSKLSSIYSFLAINLPLILSSLWPRQTRYPCLVEYKGVVFLLKDATVQK